MAKNILVYEVKHYKEVIDADNGENEMIPVTEQEYTANAGTTGYKGCYFEVLEGIKNSRPVQM